MAMHMKTGVESDLVIVFVYLHAAAGLVRPRMSSFRLSMIARTTRIMTLKEGQGMYTPYRD